ALNALLGTQFDILGEGRFWGVAIALALHLYPIIYLNATAAIANLDPSLDEAAETLGASAWRRFWRVTLPLIRPGLFAGGAVVFIWSFTELGTPLVFDYYDVTSVQIFNGIKEMSASAQPYALTAVMLVLAVVFYLLGKGVFGRSGHAASLRATRAGDVKKLSPVQGALASGAFALVTFLAVLPHIGVALMAFSEPGSWYATVLPSEWTVANIESALGHPLAFNSITNSLQLAIAAMLLDIAFGLAIGYVIVRTKVRGRSILDGLSMMPLAVPGLVMAFGFVAMSLQWPFGEGSTFLGIPSPLAGAIDIVGENPNPFPLLIIAYAVRRLPYIVRATVAGLEQVTPDLEQAAYNLGAGTLTNLRRIVIPLIMANLLAGGLLAFSFAMLEVSDSLILAQQERHWPITKAILGFTERLGDGPNIACGMGMWAMLLLTATLVGASALLGKKLGSLFRV
ncbi:MAG: iron ABC transporter permease, partial [Planctomycetota bacterium]|nr:iron ABC transporter permease [Planctomycetota bacterium]